MLDQKALTFLTIVESGNFSKAAEKLSLTQPAVSHQLRQLELELSVKLLDRSPKGITLTPEGEIVLRYTRRFVAREEAMREELLHVDHAMKRLRVGITHTSESNQVSAALARYSSKDKAPQVTIVSDTGEQLYRKLDNYEIDLAIVDEKPTPGYDYRTLDTDDLMLIMPVSHPLGKKEVVSLSDLKKEKLILRLPSSETRQLIERELLAQGKTLADFNVVMEVDNIATIKDCVKKGLGLSILPQSVCLNEHKKKKLLLKRIKNLSIVRETSLVYHSDFLDPAIVDELVAVYQKTK